MARPARLANGGIREDVFGEQLESIARFYGWRIAHFHDSRREVVRRGQRRLIGDTAAAGFPDYVLVRPPELLFVEIKPDAGAPRVTAAEAEARDVPELRLRDLTDAQAAWLSDLADVAGTIADADVWHGAPPVEVHLWRPRDWDEIQRRLARGRQLVPASFDPRS